MHCRIVKTDIFIINNLQQKNSRLKIWKIITMDVHEAQLLNADIDQEKIPPIDQKRILAFVNRFIVTTCSHLNEFAVKCENKFIYIERSLQKLEASLVILEAKLSSIPGFETKIDEPGKVKEVVVEDEKQLEEPTNGRVEEPDESEVTATDKPDVESTNGVKACDDVRYRKYFKMLQFGVPAPAVKIKMSSEGCNPDLLDTPNEILPDGRMQEEVTDE